MPSWSVSKAEDGGTLQISTRHRITFNSIEHKKKLITNGFQSSHGSVVSVTCVETARAKDGVKKGKDSFY